MNNKRTYNWFYYNGHYSTEFGLVVSTRPSYTAAAANYEELTIPGRNGSLIRKTGSYGTRTVTYECYFFAIGNVVETARRIVEWINGADKYTMLTDSYDPEYYSNAIYVDAADIKNRLNRTGRVEITFRAQPERWLKTAQEFRNISGVTRFRNEYETARPLFLYKGQEEDRVGNFQVGNRLITGLRGATSIYIDYATQNIYDAAGKNRNSEVTIYDVSTTPVSIAYDLPPIKHEETVIITPPTNATLDWAPRLWRL